MEAQGEGVAGFVHLDAQGGGGTALGTWDRRFRTGSEERRGAGASREEFGRRGVPEGWDL